MFIIIFSSEYDWWDWYSKIGQGHKFASSQDDQIPVTEEKIAHLIGRKIYFQPSIESWWQILQETIM